ncbi:MBL fold metallo-hydrolase [Candidatus Woesearchaeota archaeon]|nr:MBL fold metallo-hydrolase [Candidatus Woesearchaeota archaeon]
MKITFYGGAKEVGRSCVMVNDKYLLDAGLEIDDEIKYPTLNDPSRVEAVFIAHAHLDHTGALPLFNSKGMDCPIFATSMTKKIAKILLKDEYKIQMLLHNHPAYNEFNIKRVLASFKYVDPVFERRFDNLKFIFYPSGHIPGSCAVYIETEGKSLLYTSDINTMDTQLMQGAKDLPHADILIVESTYGDRDHPPREETEDRFIERIQKTIDKGGSVLIPVFAVGRAQEKMILLYEKLKTRVPIYLDGMAEDITRVVLEEPYFIRKPDTLRKAFQKIKTFDWKRRKQLVKEQFIMITTSGMMDGGPIIDYLKHTYFDENNAILLTGYQGENTNGRMLLEEGKVKLDEDVVKVKAYYEQFDFSAHAGRKELIKLIRRVNPEILIINHGDEPSTLSLASEFNDKQVYIPNVNDSILI